jgi:CheY-like chemotaxis protein
MLGPLSDAIASPSHALTGENLDTAYRNALRLLRLVNALLDFSRIEAGRAEASFEPTDLAALTIDLASAFRSAIERAGLRFEVDAPSLGEAIYVDHEMWEKIVLNLLSNALKFTFDGTIAVRLRLVSECVELEVSDTGSGIPTEELGNVFRRFHRIEGTRSRTHEGSGIGLALVTELVRLHGSTISVDSELGQGTTFTVRLPRGSAHLPDSRLRAKRSLASTAVGAVPFVQEAERWLPNAHDEVPIVPEELVALEASTDPSAQGGRILLADDNSDMRDYVSRLLRGRWTVQTVSDGQQALDAAIAAPPDLVLTDVMMPNLDGFGLLGALRAHPRTKNVPVIMLSARAGEEAQAEGLESGADDYLIKPFSARELIARVSTRLQIARLQRAAERERERLYEIFMQAPARPSPCWSGRSCASRSRTPRTARWSTGGTSSACRCTWCFPNSPGTLRWWSSTRSFELEKRRVRMKHWQCFERSPSTFWFRTSACRMSTATRSSVACGSCLPIETVASSQSR